MNRFRSIFALFFLLVFTFNVVIYYTLFEVNETEAKTEMGETISHMQTLLGTECFKLPLSRLQEVNRHEIWMNGKLYDIVRADVKSDSVVVYVLNDSKEETLVSDFAGHCGNGCDMNLQTKTRSHSSKHASKTPGQKYFPAAVISIHYAPGDTVVSCVINCFYLTPIPSVLAPPPQPLS